jgi:hypothetical protein
MADGGGDVVGGAENLDLVSTGTKVRYLLV